MSRLFCRSFCLLIALVVALPMMAQTQIAQVPAEAALYVGWRGASDLGPDYDGSNLQGLLQETGLLAGIPELMDVIEQMGEDGRIEQDEAQIFAMVSTLWSSAWADGGAMYVMPPEQGGPPIPRLCVFWNKGAAEQAPLREALDNLVAMIEGDLPAFAGQTGGATFLSIGFDARAIEFESLGESARFKSAVKNVQADAAVLAYVDVKGWVGYVDQLAAMMRDRAADRGREDPFAALWPKLRDVTGLAGVDSLALSAGVKGKNWHTRLFAGAPAPRKGLLSLLDHDAITPAKLSHVPKSATFLQVLSMEPGRVLEVTRQIMGAVDPNLVGELDRGLNDASEVVGFDLEKKLIKGMGSTWTAYLDPMIAGNSFASLVLMNELQDPAAIEEAMIKLSGLANEIMAEEDEVKIRFLTQNIDGADITHLGIPFIAPAWAVHDGRLYISLYPQGIEVAVKQSGKEQDSILANEAFQTAMARFVDAPVPGKAFEKLTHVTGLSFSDLPKTTVYGYGTNLMLMQAIAGTSEMLSGKASSIRMPPVGKVLPYIQVAGGITRVLDDGLHIHLIEPFPGATLLGATKGLTSGSAIAAPLAAGVMLPALGAARRTARILQATTQARQIGTANFAYATDHKGGFADDLAKLEGYFGSPEILISPRSIAAEPVPFRFAQLPQAQRAAYIRENSSFVLVPLGNFDELKNAGEMIMLFERPDHTGEDKLAVVMGDASSMTMTENELTQRLRIQTGQSIQQLIDRQENFAP